MIITSHTEDEFIAKALTTHCHSDSGYGWYMAWKEGKGEDALTASNMSLLLPSNHSKHSPSLYSTWICKDLTLRSWLFGILMCIWHMCFVICRSQCHAIWDWAWTDIKIQVNTGKPIIFSMLWTILKYYGILFK